MIKKPLPDTPFFTFIKKYPHVSAAFGILLGLILLILPIPFKAKLRVIAISAVFGFIAAVAWYHFKNKKDYGPRL